MGSLPASGIPVVLKQPVSFKKHDICIKATDNRKDVVTVITCHRPSLNRPIGSGSIVRDSGVVDYYEELVAGVTRMGRTCYERIASDTACNRQAFVQLGDNETIAVIPTGLLQTTPQLWTSHRSEKIAVSDSTNDTQIRVKSTGPFDKV
ncbi:hypothetical protein E4G67_01610 [Candidatus Bathyarchaeota archaeon]|nr:MAG: hypothetical protein E4G67_01610 [Candidatus Bathyarchaeota archaeon]